MIFQQWVEVKCLLLSIYADDGLHPFFPMLRGRAAAEWNEENFKSNILTMNNMEYLGACLPTCSFRKKVNEEK